MLRKFFDRLFGKAGRKRCAIAQCWLDATRRHQGHDLCDYHYHEYTYDVGMTGKKL